MKYFIFGVLINCFIIYPLLICENISIKSSAVHLEEGIEIFYPCKDPDILVLTRQIKGIPELEENYFDATLYTDVSLPIVSMELDSTAKIELHPDHGRVILYDQKPQIDLEFFPILEHTYDFTVRGLPGDPMPNITSFGYCDIVEKWNPVFYPQKIKKKFKTIGNNIINCGTNSTSDNHEFWLANIYHITNKIPSLKCGGNLIDLNAVLTAAHCILEDTRQINPERILIKLENNRFYNVLNVTIHDQFNSTTLEHDIAIIKINISYSDTKILQPICLWNKFGDSIDDVHNKHGNLYTWQNSINGVTQNNLIMKTLPVIAPSTCAISNPEFFKKFLTHDKFCAGYRNNASVCRGDSGSGLFFKDPDDDIYRIRGIVSLISKNETVNCNDKDYAIFTNVAQYLYWINSIIE